MTNLVGIASRKFCGLHRSDGGVTTGKTIHGEIEECVASEAKVHVDVLEERI